MKTLKSRYSLANISSNVYGSLNEISNYPMSVQTSGGTFSQGYIFVPYILQQTSSIIVDNDSFWYKQMKKEQRLKKLNRLNEIQG